MSRSHTASSRLRRDGQAGRNAVDLAAIPALTKVISDVPAP